MDEREILRRLVLNSTGEYDIAIQRVLNVVIEDLHIAWAHVDGRQLSVYCYKQREGDKLKRIFGGHVTKAITQRGDEKYWLWHWSAPYV